jgi:hypothetical protein
VGDGIMPDGNPLLLLNWIACSIAVTNQPGFATATATFLPEGVAM